MNRLARIEGAKALPDIRAYGAGDWIRGSRAGYFSRLLLAGGDRVLGEVQAAANPNSDEFEYGAALTLYRFGHLDEAAFKDLLYTATVNICLNTKSPPIRVNEGLLEDTRDDRCALLLAGIAGFNRQDGVFSYGADIAESDRKPAALVLAMIREQRALPQARVFPESCARQTSRRLALGRVSETGVVEETVRHLCPTRD